MIHLNKQSGLIHNSKSAYEVAFMYRYAALFCTSVFYYFTSRSDNKHMVILFILCIGATSLIHTYLYKKNLKNHKIVSRLILMETIEYAILLVPTGGLRSPYVWYFINTVILASIIQEGKNAYRTAGIYLLGVIFNMICEFSRYKVHFKVTSEEQVGVFLSIAIVLGALGVFVKITDIINNEKNKLGKSNMALMRANERVFETMNQMISFQKAVASLTDERDEKEIIRLILDYTMAMTRSKGAFYRKCIQGSEFVERGRIDNIRIMEEEMEAVILNELIRGGTYQDIKKIHIDDRVFHLIKVESAYSSGGFIGIELSDEEEPCDEEEKSSQLTVLAQIGSIALERGELEKMNSRLLVSEEQNRIADEIHDSVQQKLFGMSCAIYSLKKNIERGYDNKKIYEELDNIRKTADNVMKELRFTIYGMSWKKEGENTFLSDIKQYISELSMLVDVEMSFEVRGNHERISTRQKKAVYRIICEGVGNAVRHGQAKKIKTVLKIERDKIRLFIHDDGRGFDINEKGGGIGLRNIENLAKSLKGDMFIDSEIDRGTRMEVQFCCV